LQLDRPPLNWTQMLATRLLRFLIALAMLLAPISMMGTHAAMAMPSPAPAAMADHGTAEATAGHCAEMPAPGEQAPDQAPAKSIDCMIACSCVPPAIGDIAEPAALPALAQRPALALPLHGLNPKAEPRPPRFS
jgi:hypothetical protein